MYIYSDNVIQTEDIKNDEVKKYIKYIFLLLVCYIYLQRVTVPLCVVLLQLSLSTLLISNTVQCDKDIINTEYGQVERTSCL